MAFSKDEKKCPKCGEDMKEYVTKYWCRNRYKCGHLIEKEWKFLKKHSRKGWK